MKKIVIFEPNLKLNEIIRSAILSCVEHFEVISFFELNDIVSYVTSESDSTKLLVLSHYSTGFNALDVVRTLSEIGILVPSLLISESQPESIYDYQEFEATHKDNSFLLKPFDVVQLSALVQKMLSGIVDFEVETSELLGFVPISSKVIAFKEYSVCDIYIKISSKKYIPILKEADLIDHESLKYFEEKGIENFYIRKDDKEIFFNLLLSQVGSPDYEFNPSKIKSDLTFQQEVLNMVFVRFQSLEIDQELLNSTKRVIENNLTLINKAKSLKLVLKNILGNNKKILEHSITTNFLCQLILRKLAIDTHAVQMKVAVASFFHDIILNESKENIELLESLNTNKIEELKQSKSEFLLHPVKSAQKIQDFDGICLDTLAIIENHHELPFGKGFPRGLHGERTPFLSSVFNTIHYFCAQCYLKGWNRKSISQILLEMDEDFSDKNYDKTFNVLKKIFK